jgi:putative Holliday junction resolvase
MRLLALDYGTKRIGVAVSDELAFGAYPLTTIHRSRLLTHDLQEILRIAQKEEVGAIVVGLPLNADGTQGSSAKNAASFAASLGKRTTLPIHLHDEFLTTAEAEEAMISMDVSRKKRRETIDKAAAALILDSYLRAQRERASIESMSEAPTDASKLTE